MFIQTLRSLFGAPEARRAQALYIALVKQSREAFFYADCAVADTLDGRFEILLLHVFLALHLLRARGGSETALSRRVLECFFADMDRNLREMGVGDMGVGKRVKIMSRAAFGHLEAYTAAWHSPDALRAAVARNVYRGAEPQGQVLEKLMQYMRSYKLPEILV